ncbi:MAG: hypothetical protein R2729_07940 [Bryobacteraceae bacterium]
MDSNALIIVMAAAVTVSALALVSMALMVFGIFRNVRLLREQVSAFLPRAEAFVETGHKTLTETREQVREIGSRAAAVLDSTQSQLVRVDAFVGETTGRARVQMDRVELMLDDTLSRMHETVMQLNSTVVKPVREINAVAAGVRATLQHFLRRSQPNITEVTSDEEMFI